MKKGCTQCILDRKKGQTALCHRTIHPLGIQQNMKNGEKISNLTLDLDTSFTSSTRVVHNVQLIYDPIKSLQDIFLELGTLYPLRPCPEPPYPMVSVYPHPDPSTTFVPEDLVEKFCTKKP